MDNMRRNCKWMFGAIFLVALVLLGLRWSSSIQNKGPVFDEQYITVPINNLIEDGWSIQTAIDFQETKGPAMIWPYAIIGEWFGGTLHDLRLVSVWFSILAIVVLVWIAFVASCTGEPLFLLQLDGCCFHTTLSSVKL